MEHQNQSVIIANRILVFIQIILLLLIALTFVLGYTIESITTGSFFYAILLGAVGSSISVMRRINSGEEAIIHRLTNDRIFSIFRPILYGTLMSGVVYLLFMSEIISGEGGGGFLTTNLFPKFAHENNTSLSLVEQFVSSTPEGIRESGKLLVWCFIAGYSERFVSGLLERLEAKTGESDEAS